jgi:formate dehydrogenase major subunit
MLKKKNGIANGSRLSSALAAAADGAVDRRTFLRRSGLAIGGIAAATTLTTVRVKAAQSHGSSDAPVELRKSV